MYSLYSCFIPTLIFLLAAINYSSAQPTYKTRGYSNLNAKINTVLLPVVSTTGDLIVVEANYVDQVNSVASVTDSKGNTYQAIPNCTSNFNNANKLRGEVWYAYNIIGGGAVITVTVTLTNVPTSSGPLTPFSQIYVTEFSGIITASDPLDQSAVAIGTTSPPTSANVTAAYTNELIFGACINGGGSVIGVGAGFTVEAINNGNITEWKQSNTTGGPWPAVFTNGGGSLDWIAQVATFRSTTSNPIAYYSVANTNWNVASTWSIVGCGGAVAATIPAAGTVVNICNGNTVTIPAGYAASAATLNITPSSSGNATLTLAAGGASSLTISGNILIESDGTGSTTGTLNVNTTNTVTISGTLTVHSRKSGANKSTSTVQMGGGTLTASGLVSVNSDAGGNNAAITFSGSDLLQLGTAGTAISFSPGGGGVTATINNPTAGAGTAGTIEYNNAGNQTIEATAADVVYYNLTASNGGTKTLNAAATVKGNLSISGSAALASGAFTHTISGSTTMSGSSIINPNNVAGIFNLQSLSMTGTSSIAGTAPGFVNTATTFSVPSGTSTIGQGNFTVTGATSITGSLTFNNDVGVKTFIGAVTINAGGSWTSTTIATTGNLVFKNGITSIGTSFAAGSATFNTNTPQAIAGATAVSFANTVQVTGIAVTNNNSGGVTMSNTAAGTLTGTGTWTQGTGAYILNYAGSTITVTTFNASGVGNTVTYNRTDGTQTIFTPSSASSYYNLTLNNTFATSPQFSLSANVSAANALTMTSGTVNLSGFTLTLGTAAATPGTLTYTAGFLYGGTFTRWFGTAVLPLLNVRGHFPMGTSVGDYRPLWLAYTAILTAGGTVSLVHNPTYPSGTNAASQTDASWAGGTVLQGVSNSNWVVSTANGFALSAANGQMRFGGQGFQTFVLTDLDAAQAATAVGTYAASTSAAVPLEVNRTGLSTASLANTWVIGTKNVITSPLPVELLSFNAEPNGNIVDVVWKTVSEFNSAYFVVQCSQDGTIFNNVIQVKGVGNSTTIKNYSTEDYEPYNGVSYYRLKQVDNDGKFTYSGIVAVRFHNDNVISVYPNPSVQGEPINVSISGQNGKQVLVVVRDLQGREFDSKIILFSSDTEVIAIDPSGKLAAGVYLVVATSNDIICQKKIVIR